MEIKVYRYNSAKDHSNSIILINGKFECYGLEDEFRSRKFYGDTRISDGKYSIVFRTVGGFHNRYLNKFGYDFHKGMLWIKNVPNFEYVLIHIGNDDDDTAGCLLVGDANARGENWITNSTKTYKELYPKIRDALLRSEDVSIEFITLDKV